MSALAALTADDFLKPLLKRASKVSKIIGIRVLVIAYGAVAIGIAFVINEIGGNVFQMGLSMTGVVGGPQLGLYLFGALFPCATTKGALGGGLTGFAFMLWLLVGSEVSPVGTHHDYMPSDISNCANYMNISETFSVTESPPVKAEGLMLFYQLSYLYYTAMGAAVTVVAGLFITSITGCGDPAHADPTYHIPLFTRMCCCLPKKSLHILSCKLYHNKNKKVTCNGSSRSGRHANGTISNGSSKEEKHIEILNVEEPDPTLTTVSETICTNQSVSEIPILENQVINVAESPLRQRTEIL